MALKKERSSFTVSNSLKTAMAAKNFPVHVQEGNTYYDGGASDIHVPILRFSDATYRTVTNATQFTDIVAEGDPAMVRMWIEDELQVFVASLPGVESVTSAQQGQTWPFTVTRNGQPFQGSSQNKVDALANATISLLNSL